MDNLPQDEEGISLAIITSRFNEEVTSLLYEGAISRLAELGFEEDELETYWVPGALEIPLAAQRLARTGHFDAIICLGAVIRGETSHFDYVCSQVSQGIQKVMLENDLPVIFGVLTTENKEQCLDRLGGAHGHKGREAVDAAFDMIDVLQEMEPEYV